MHKTHDPWHVKILLGHKSIKSTETYIHIEKMLYLDDNICQFTVKVADAMKDEINLLAVRFEFHVEVQGHRVFRKQ